MPKRSCHLILALAAHLYALSIAADNTAGVFGPAVPPDYGAIQYRGSYNPQTDLYTQRIHYERASSDSLMWRGVLALRDQASSGTDFDFFQAELFWERTPNEARWRRGWRFDLRVRDNDRPAQFGLNWMHEFRLADKWRARVLALSTAQFGSNRRSGVFLQSRGSLSYRLSPRFSADLELFSSYGSTRDFDSPGDQQHQVGPALVARLPGGWQLLLSALHGLNSASPRTNARMWLTKTFSH